MSYQLEFKLPFSKSAVVMTMPNWGVSEEVNREAKQLDLTATQATAVLLSKIVTIDGKQVMGDDFKNLPFKDYTFIVDKWNEWESGSDAKNE